MSLLNPLITLSGWIYGQSALHHPPGHIRAYPMYYPSENGDRLFRGQRYAKYTRLVKPEERVQQPYSPEPKLDPWSAVIPRSEIFEEIDCQQCFREWRRTNDPRKYAAEALFRRAGVPLHQIGLTGSLALGCPGDNLDLDLLVHGTQHVAPCVREIEKMLHRGEVQFMSDDTAKRYARRYADLYSLPLERLYHLFRLDLTKLYVGEKKMSIIFAYDAHEYNSIPTSLYANDNGSDINIQGRVVTRLSSWLYPREYLIMSDDGELYSVWSHHWLYKTIASAGVHVSVTARDAGDRILSVSALHHFIIPD